METDNRYAVAIFGVPDFERELVVRIFSVSESRDNVYRIVSEASIDTADIVLLDTADADATNRYEQFHSQREGFPTVAIANGKDHGFDYWVKRPFTVTRMLGALDQLVKDKLCGVERPKPAAPAPKEATEPPATTAATGTYTALVVDDSLPVRQQLSVALRRAGIAAEFAEDGESALQLIETRNYDIVFLDIVLPGIDGYEVCKTLKSNKEKQHIPVVILTVKSSSADRIKGEMAGCDAYLTKPISLKGFNNALSEFLDPPPTFESMADAS